MTKPRIIVRQAQELDGHMGACLIRRSIFELCVQDHNSDEIAIREWVSNKTVESWKMWLESDRSTLRVAEIDGTLAGVGMLSRKGEIFLLYVDPKFRFLGISKCVLSTLEDIARGWGCTSIFLESTKTAYRFYREHGYEPDHNLGQLRLRKALP